MKILKEYAEDPVNNFQMQDYTIKHEEGNIICGSGIVVFLKIDKKLCIKDFSFSWSPSTLPLGGASLLAENIIWKNIQEILSLWYNFFQEKGISVPKRKKKLVSISLLAAKNAIHNYLQDGIEEDFDDIL